MKRMVLTLMLACMLLLGGLVSGAYAAEMPEALSASYYLDPEAPAYTYLQNNSIRRFLDMWVESNLGEDIAPQWQYDTLAPVQVLDHAFADAAKLDTPLYTCIFTSEDGRCGYIIVEYIEDDPSIGQWGLMETTPALYDLRANERAIAAALEATDIDLTTATASRVNWVDTDNNRSDQIILFADGKGDRYVCHLGDEQFTIEKQQEGLS